MWKSKGIPLISVLALPSDQELFFLYLYVIDVPYTLTLIPCKDKDA